MIGNPFTYLPVDVCGDLDIPNFPVIQDCTSYAQLRSEISGLLIRPPTALGAPITWYNFSSWSVRIDNEDHDAVHFIAGRGGFLQTEKETVVLADGRVEENRERTSRLTFSILNMDDGHVDFARKLQANKRDFFVWAYTLGGRVIGGHSGMRPVFTDAEFPFAQGKDSRESVTLIIDVEYQSFPEW